jgi:hypothetical protein
MREKERRDIVAPTEAKSSTERENTLPRRAKPNTAKDDPSREHDRIDNEEPS